MAAFDDPAMPTAEQYNVSEREGNSLSSKGFMYGYISAVLQLVISSAFVFYFDDGRKWGLTQTYPMQICIAIICFIQVAGLLSYTLPMLKSRPGPPLPEGKGNFVALSYSNRKN